MENYKEFIRGVADAMGVSTINAEAQWAGYSRNMHDAMRDEEQRGGYKAGLQAGAEILDFN